MRPLLVDEEEKMSRLVERGLRNVGHALDMTGRGENAGRPRARAEGCRRGRSYHGRCAASEVDL